MKHVLSLTMITQALSIVFTAEPRMMSAYSAHKSNLIVSHASFGIHSSLQAFHIQIKYRHLFKNNDPMRTTYLICCSLEVAEPCLSWMDFNLELERLRDTIYSMPSGKTMLLFLYSSLSGHHSVIPGLMSPRKTSPLQHSNA